MSKILQTGPYRPAHFWVPMISSLCRSIHLNEPLSAVRLLTKMHDLVTIRSTPSPAYQQPAQLFLSPTAVRNRPGSAPSYPLTGVFTASSHPYAP